MSKSDVEMAVSRMKRVTSRAKYAMRVLDSLKIAGDYSVEQCEYPTAKVFVGDISWFYVRVSHTREHIALQVQSILSRKN